MAVELISHTVVGAGGTTEISLSSIPQTYDDLQIFLSLRTNDAGRDTLLMRFSGDASNTYRTCRMYAFDQAVQFSRPGTDTGIWASTIPGTNQQASLFSCTSMYIPAYKNTYDKAIISNGYSGSETTSGYGLTLTAGRWGASQSISSIAIRSYNSATIQQNSTVSLYGIKRA
jgi:hypothetical protein